MSSGSPKTSRFGIQAMFLVLFAVLCGIAGTGLRQWRQTPQAVEAPAAAPQQFRILLAASDLLTGREIKASDFYTSMLGKDEYKKALQNVSAFGDGKQLIGRIIRTKVEMNKPFPLDCVFPEGTGPTPADLLSSGMRAITVKMNLVGGIRGFVAPESWVDVLFRRSDKQVAPDSTAAARTHTVFPGVRVLAIQDSLYPQTVLTKDQHGSVAQEFEITLELTPQQCEVLKSIENRGELTLNMLPRDPERANSGALPSPETMKLLLGVEEPKPVAVAPAVPSVRLVRGGTQSSVVVDQSYDLVIDRHVYPAPAKPDGDSANTVPDPDMDAVPATVWPQAIPPAPASVNERTTSGSSTSAGDNAATPDSPQPATPEPARGSRAIQDTVFAKRSGPVRYPGRERVPGAPAPSSTRYRASASEMPSARSSRSVFRVSNSGSVGTRADRTAKVNHLSPALTVIDSTRARGSVSVYSNASPGALLPPGSTGGRSLALLNPQSTATTEILRSTAQSPRSSERTRSVTPSLMAARSTQSPTRRSLIVSAGSPRRITRSGLIELGSGATSSADSSLAYLSAPPNSALPELKIGRR